MKLRDLRLGTRKRDVRGLRGSLRPRPDGVHHSIAKNAVHVTVVRLFQILSVKKNLK